MFGDGEQQLSIDVFAMHWGVQHEMNGIVSSLSSFPKVSESIATKLKFSVPREVHALEQGLLFLSPRSPFVLGTVFCCTYCSICHGSIPRCIVGRRWRFQSFVGSEVHPPIH